MFLNAVQQVIAGFSFSWEIGISQFVQDWEKPLLGKIYGLEIEILFGNYQVQYFCKLMTFSFLSKS